MNSQDSRYPFAPIRDGAFFFITDFGASYFVEFAQASYKLGDNKILKNNGEVFEISISKSADLTKYDPLVFNTMLFIFSSNIQSKGDISTYFYVCDTTDGKGKSRAKLFDKWFPGLQKLIPRLRKINFIVPGFGDEEFDVCLLIFENHPNFDSYLLEFETTLADNFSKKQFE